MLAKVLKPFQHFGEVLVYDTGSTDRTLEIASKFSNVTIVQGVLNGFGPTHNLASSLAAHDWIFVIDSDEVATEECVREIEQLSLNPDCVYSFPTHNYYNGKWIKHCGWYPDRHLRLYDRTRTRFNDLMVHESVITTGMQEVDLAGPVNHYSFQNVSDFLRKMQTYSSLFAEQHQGKRKSSPTIALGHGVAAFLKSYLLKKGFLDGYEGFLISAYNSHTTFYKYLKLYEANLKAELLI